MIYLLKIIIAIAVIILINLRELLQSKSRGKVMGIYFTIIGISLAFAIIIFMDKEPTSPTVVLMNVVKSLGWGDG